MTRRIAAIFDVDGTLISGTSLERLFVGFLWRYGELGGFDLLRFGAGALEALAAGRSALKANKAYLGGKDASHLRRLARDCFEQEVRRRLLPSAVGRLRWHGQAGHCVILLSGALDLLLAPLAEHLGVYARLGTELESGGRHFTGRVKGEHPFGPAKAECLAALNCTGAFDLAHSFAYADHYADRHLLASVGHPVAANPDRRLRRLAERRGWMIEDFTAAAREAVLTYQS